MTRADLEAEFTRTLTPYFPGGVPVSLVASLSLAASGYTATAIEETCRTPVSQMGPGRRREPPGVARKTA